MLVWVLPPSHLETSNFTEARRVREEESEKSTNWYILLVAIEANRPTLKNSHERLLDKEKRREKTKS
ncbi:hypothetical protein KCV05_g11, partial [Aureobasidium melanogenum]